MFAAPDVARPVFDQKVRRIAPHANRVTVYASSTDAALLGFQLLRSGAPRMGELQDGEPLTVEVKNVHVIDATGPDRWWRILTGYGHGYFGAGSECSVGYQADPAVERKQGIR